MQRITVPTARIEASNTSFYYPPTLMDDYTNYQLTDVPHSNYTFELVGNWYARSQPGYEPIYIRGAYFPINWKSKVGNSDANSNLKTDYSTVIRKGDIVIREDGNIYILNWKVQNQPNNQSTQAIDLRAAKFSCKQTCL